MHALERHREFSSATWKRLTYGLPLGAFYVALTSIPYRESWKYGERAYRYCQHDAGHVLAALRLAVAMLGWFAQLLPAVGDDQINRLLGLDRDDAFDRGEPEVPELLLLVDSAAMGVLPLTSEAIGSGAERYRGSRWYGRVNRLSSKFHLWPAIDRVEGACRQRLDTPGGIPCRLVTAMKANLVSPSQTTVSAMRIIRHQRSLLAMDGATAMTCGALCRMLSRVLRVLSRSPWDALPWQPFVHLALFVHRVTHLASGFYALVRNDEQLEGLRAAVNTTFAWRRPTVVPEHLPLYLLRKGDMGSVATRVGCNQEIAGQSAPSLGMLAYFEPVIEQYGATAYCQLFWETGVVGQVLYSGGPSGTAQFDRNWLFL